MVKTGMPGADDESGRGNEIADLEQMMRTPWLETHRAERARPIGSEILKAAAFGTPLSDMAPFEIPNRLNRWPLTN